MTHPAAFYKSLRLGDTVRSHPPIAFSLAGSAFQDVPLGARAAYADVGSSAKVTIDVEPVLIRNFDQATGDMSTGETDAAFFGRKLDFIADAVSASSYFPSDYTDRYGPLCWVDDPVSAGKRTVSGTAADAGPPVTHVSLTLTSGVAADIANGDLLLLVSGDDWILLTANGTTTAGATTVAIIGVPETVDFPWATAFPATLYIPDWVLENATISGSFKAAGGDVSPQAMKGEALVFESAETPWRT